MPQREHNAGLILITKEKNMSRNIIYCFSGAGGCLDMAKTVASELGDTDIVMMRAFPKVTDARGAERVGFIFPVYGGGLPGEIEEFIRSIRMDGTQYKFGLVQYAAYMGCGLSKLDELIDLDYWGGISNHSSCIWLMPHTLTLPRTSLGKAQQRVDIAAAAFAADIKNRKYMFAKPPKRTLNRIESAAFSKLGPRKVRKYTVSDACVGCGTCAKLCPRVNIRIADGRPVFGDSCMGCLSCVQYCPKAAIDIGKITKKRERYHNARIEAEELMQNVIHID